MRSPPLGERPHCGELRNLLTEAHLIDAAGANATSNVTCKQFNFNLAACQSHRAGRHPCIVTLAGACIRNKNSSCLPGVSATARWKAAGPPQASTVAFWAEWLRRRAASSNRTSSIRHAASTRPGENGEPPPRVFVYRLPPPLSDLGPDDAAFDLAHTFGVPRPQHALHGAASVLDGPFGMSSGYAFAAMLHYRLWHSRMYRTLNAHDADLFFVPILTKPKREASFAAACTELAHLGSDGIAARLEHLTRRTASRHVLVLSKEHMAMPQCTGWWENATGLLASAIRIGYSHVQPDSLRKALRHDGYSRDVEPFYAHGRRPFPNLASVPFPSSVHRLRGSRTAPTAMVPWNATTRRQYRMSFMGAATHGDVAVRRKILYDCAEMGEPACWAGSYELGDGIHWKVRACLHGRCACSVHACDRRVLA